MQYINTLQYISIYLYIYIIRYKCIYIYIYINNVKKVLNTIVEQIIHITGSNSINTYKLLPVSYNWRLRNHETGSSLYVLILFDSALCIYICLYMY